MSSTRLMSRVLFRRGLRGRAAAGIPLGIYRFIFFLLLVPLFFLTPQFSLAQDKPLALGLGVEGNMNTVSSAAAAFGFSATLDLGRFFAGGLRTGYSYNFSNTGTLEMAALGRWYFLTYDNSRLFAQVELGTDLIFFDGETIPAFLGGLALGWRLPLGSWYMEPVLRGGYPYIWGLGLGFGRRI
jgi:hypothetical protein